MADTAITLTSLTPGTVSADLITTAEGGTAVTAGNIAVIDCGGHTGDMILTFYASSAATAIVQAGDNPPALRQGLGNSATQTLPAGDVVIMCVEAGRYAQDNGTIRVTIGSNTTVVGAYKIPRSI